MEKIQLPENIAVYCLAATSFPDGVLAAHQAMHRTFAYDGTRRFFGLSKPQNGQIQYEVAVEILPDDDPAQYEFHQRLLLAGEYNSILIRDFRKDLGSLGRAFAELTQQPNIDLEAWCVEWYQGMDDVLCMLRVVG